MKLRVPLPTLSIPSAFRWSQREYCHYTTLNIPFIKVEYQHYKCNYILYFIGLFRGNIFCKYQPNFLKFGKGTPVVFEVQAIPLQTLTCPEGSRRLRIPHFLDNRHMKVARLSALRTGHFNHHVTQAKKIF
jgi:hypothetical protein